MESASSVMCSVCGESFWYHNNESDHSYTPVAKPEEEYKPSRQQFYDMQQAVLDLKAGVLLPAETTKPPVLPSASSARKSIPLARGVLDYFPAALAEVAKLSQAGNDKHNPGEDLHWARGKSMDHADCIMRHLVDRGTADAEDGISHTAKVAWRALALLQEELEAGGAPKPRGAR